MHMGSLIQVFWESCVGKSQIGLSLSSLRSSRTCAESGPDPDRLENHLFAFAREVLGSRPLACSTVKGAARASLYGDSLSDLTFIGVRVTGIKCPSSSLENLRQLPLGKNRARRQAGLSKGSVETQVNPFWTSPIRPVQARRYELSTWNWGSRFT